MLIRSHISVQQGPHWIRSNVRASPITVMEQSLLVKGDEEYAELPDKLERSHRSVIPTPGQLPMLPSEYS